MYPTEPSKAKKARVVYYLSLVVLLLLAAVYVGCKSDTNKNGSAQQTVTESASPSPRPSPSTEILPPGDTIIVIKDGSVDIQVTMSLCTDVTNPGGPNFSYRCDNRDLDNMEIKTTAPGSTNAKANPTSKITIDGGGDKDIVVKGNPRHVKIDFRKTDYPLCTSQPAPGHHCGTNHVGKVTMDTPPFEKNCNPTEKCDVKINGTTPTSP